MNNLWKKESDAYQSSAKVVDGNLILSLPDAINPVVWRMELGSVKASALEIKPSADGATFLLSLKTPKGEVYDIAPYATRDQALRALMRVSSALQGAHGRFNAPQISAAAPSSAQGHAAISSAAANDTHGGSAIKWLLTLGGVLFVIVLFAYLSTLSPKRGESFAPTATSTGTQSSTNSETGIPQSADDLFKGY